MFGRKKLNPGTIDCLIGAGTAIQGDVRFRGGLRIDGEVRGNVIAEDGAPSMLVLSENARVEGQVTLRVQPEFGENGVDPLLNAVRAARGQHVVDPAGGVHEAEVRAGR